MGADPKGLDQATQAFRRLLADVGSSAQARVDALVAFSQRAALAPTWPGQSALRTLTNREGETAMPLFTGLDVLDETASRFGWRNADGSLPMRTLDAREALSHALARGVQFVVIDIGSEHAVEFQRAEFEPLLSLDAQGTGPFAAAGGPQVQLLDAVRRSTRPPSLHATAARAPTGGKLPEIDVPFSTPRARGASQPLHARAISRPMREAGLLDLDTPPQRAAAQPSAQARAASQPMMSAARPGSQSTMAGAAMPPSAAREAAAQARTAASLAAARPPSVMPPAMTSAPHAARVERAPAPSNEAPATDAERESGEQARELQPGSLPDDLLHAISAGLRGFPEVEWACVLTDGGELPSIGVRVDPSFLNRVAQITDAIMQAADNGAQAVQVRLLNTTELVKTARKQGTAFYPWKR